jgi:hypothetical protein
VRLRQAEMVDHHPRIGISRREFTVSYLIAPVYGWFTEGFDTPALNKTKGLLELLDA